MSLNYVQVAEEEGEEPIEVPCEEDGTLLLTTLAAQFPGTCGLKYRNPATGTMRGVRVSDGKLLPPHGSGWDDSLYICVFPKVTENKRKSCDQLENSSAKTKRMETKHKCSDLIVLGLPWKTTEQELRQYFESFGEVLMAQVKKDPKTGSSKGFGFIRFSNYESQARALSKRHLIDGRWCDVRIPNSKDGQVAELNRKVFIGRCTEDITADDLEEYFSKYGEKRSVYTRKIGFVSNQQWYNNPRKRTRKKAIMSGTTELARDLSTHYMNPVPVHKFSLRPSSLSVLTDNYKFCSKPNLSHASSALKESNLGSISQSSSTAVKNLVPGSASNSLSSSKNLAKTSNFTFSLSFSNDCKTIVSNDTSNFDLKFSSPSLLLNISVNSSSPMKKSDRSCGANSSNQTCETPSFDLLSDNSFPFEDSNRNSASIFSRAYSCESPTDAASSMPGDTISICFTDIVGASNVAPTNKTHQV